jgi:hypothetical protein
MYASASAIVAVVGIVAAIIPVLRFKLEEFPRESARSLNFAATV